MSIDKLPEILGAVVFTVVATPIIGATLTKFRHDLEIYFSRDEYLKGKKTPSLLDYLNTFNWDTNVRDVVVRRDYVER